MQLPRELTTVTPVSKAVALILFIAMPIVGFFAGMRYQRELTAVSAPVSPAPAAAPPSPTDVPTALPVEQPTCTPANSSQISLTATGSARILTDRLNGYRFDFTSLPDAQLSDTLSCANRGYELDLYKRREVNDGSVARVMILAPYLNTARMTLPEYAKQEFRYVEGKHVDEQNNYGQAFTSTPLREETLSNGMRVLSWTDIYTEAETHQEGLTAAKFYLIETDGRILPLYVMSWDMPAFRRATQDFEKVLPSLTFSPL